MEQPIWNFEQEPYPDPHDETDYNLRAYFDRMDDEKMQAYSPAWTDAELMEWDGNFTSDDALLVPCCERDIDLEEYRRVIGQALEYRNRVRPLLAVRS